MSKSINADLQKQMEEMKTAGVYKTERILSTPQSPALGLADGQEVLNFCANNYLGLSNNPEVVKASQETMDRWGYGLSSVRFICGTQELHTQLEKAVSKFLGMEDTILYSSCFDANGGVFEPLLGEDSAIISDELNHASIIDGVRLSKARRYRYKHSNMEQLEEMLKDCQDAKYRMIVTDGVFSMDGDIALLPQICDLAEKYDALVMVDDSHATGYLGKTGRGTHEHCGVQGRVDIITTTFGKALGGASGGCLSASKEIVQFLRQKSRPYLFSNTLAPAVAGGVLKVMEMLSSSSALCEKVMANTTRFHKGMSEAGFDLKPMETAIVPVMVYDEPLAVKMADMLLKEGIYVIGFTYPVVPMGTARIRVQISAAHTDEQIDTAISAFVKVGKELKVIK
ncbi:MAG: glycine C-acetyltransferase [Candidatus Cloacimonetes bacterium]|nr:glycine C-acetyltransferase [Candidatus Cloacimonadota bacterium]NLO11077.1 glycine C-acetyltransferase [Candidatus Cloacimonadota bacterium]